MTALSMVYDAEKAEIRMASAGGGPSNPYDERKDKGRLIQVKRTTLGRYGAGEGKVMEYTFRLNKGDFVLAQTDGLIECFNSRQEPFNRLKSQKKFIGLIKKDHSAQKLLDVTMDKGIAHKGKDRDFDDDVTIVTLKIIIGSGDGTDDYFSFLRFSLWI